MQASFENVSRLAHWPDRLMPFSNQRSNERPQYLAGSKVGGLLADATDINDHEQIVGTGTWIEMARRAFLFTGAGTIVSMWHGGACTAR